MGSVAAQGQMNAGISLAFQVLDSQASENLSSGRAVLSSFQGACESRSGLASSLFHRETNSTLKESCSSFTHFSVKGYTHVSFTPRSMA
jgi:hypothetical protein